MLWKVKHPDQSCPPPFDTAKTAKTTVRPQVRRSPVRSILQWRISVKYYSRMLLARSQCDLRVRPREALREVGWQLKRSMFGRQRLGIVSGWELLATIGGRCLNGYQVGGDVEDTYQ